jgi:transposase
MQYVGIDQHKRHLTICVRNEQGDIVLRQQVSTNWKKIDAFLEKLRDDAGQVGGYVAMLEICGFNHWLIRRLNQWGCRQVYLIAAPERTRQKTDRRDAAKLGELLWINRDRIAAGESLVHVKTVYQPTEDEQVDRQLTAMRRRLGQNLTRVKNAIGSILRRHNLEQECPTKGAFTQQALRWLETVELPTMDRMEMNTYLAQYRLLVSQVKEMQDEIDRRAQRKPVRARVRRVRTLPRIGNYTALALLAHIGSIKRFPNARSLANFFGLTPGCRNSGSTDRLGSITKAGHPLVRFLLGQMVLHVLRGDPSMRSWYQKIKRRRGTKIARVAVMRRLCEALWHMLTEEQDYRPAQGAA